LGTLTYSLYMLHPVVGVILIKFIGERSLHLQGVWLNTLIVASGFIVFIPAYFSYVYFETPLRRWMSGQGFAKRQI